MSFLDIRPPVELARITQTVDGKTLNIHWSEAGAALSPKTRAQVVAALLPNQLAAIEEPTIVTDGKMPKSH